MFLYIVLNQGITHVGGFFKEPKGGQTQCDKFLKHGTPLAQIIVNATRIPPGPGTWPVTCHGSGAGGDGGGGKLSTKIGGRGGRGAGGQGSGRQGQGAGNKGSQITVGIGIQND